MSPITLPDHAPVSAAALRAVAARHGLTGIDGAPVPLTQTGMINTVYALGPHLVLRVPRNHPGHVAQLLRERAAVPAARAAGVRTPALVAFDDSREILPVPYAVYERVAGTPFELLGHDVRAAPAVWRELGRDLGRLHAGAAKTGGARDLSEGAPMPDPRDLVERRAGEGWFTAMEARWLLRWLERLAPAALEPVPKRLIHADTQPTNVLVAVPDGAAPAYEALIDWGCAQWGDDAVDIACAPLGAAPLLLEGHREIAPLTADESAEARVLWHNWQIALATLPRGAVPGFSWGENPTARVIDTLRFFAAQPGGRWQTWRPKA
jgi:Ser/Thr protein kinase RdoA (MazF antagonist)